ncbi:MAG: H(+)-transporting V1 sector ATPase subunit H [Chrysothrix sp. TS-e1954]|nr:MAG: H(+)-transporting V1 sector ATPase subunit H [Chrysothrix sp. TS-e1954]
MSLEPPEYLLALQNNIRARPIGWEGAVRAKTITDADLKKIKSIDKVRKEQRQNTIEEDLNGFCKLFLGGEDSHSIFQQASAGKRQDILQYLLVLIGDLIDDIPSFATTLAQHPDPYKPILPLLKQSSNPEEPIPLLTSSVLSHLISHALATSRKTPSHIDETLPQLYSFLSGLAQNSDSKIQDIAVQEYSALLRTKRSRELFWKQREHTLNPLIDVLRAAVGTSKDTDSTLFSGGSSIRSKPLDTTLSGGVSIQSLYHVLLVVWQLSFEGGLIGKDLDEEHDIIPLYIQLLRISPKEKVARLLLSTIYNLLSTNRNTLLPAAVQARLPALLNNVKGRHLTDPDLLEDLENLKNMLEEYSKSQTTFDQYAAELNAGHLRWSPPHRNANFWRDNGRRIVEENKGELPRKLAEIMGKEWDSDRQVLAIGCNDLAFMVKECPDKKQTLEKLGLKARVMQLMQAEDESVRWESLRAVGEWLRYSFDN